MAQHKQFFSIEIYYIGIKIAMQKRPQMPRRAQSLSLKKPSRSLQLPRFYSRSKNSVALLKNQNANESEAANYNNQNKASNKLTKVQMAQIVSRIKQKKVVSRNMQSKPVSQKKITAFNSSNKGNGSGSKANRKQFQNCIEVRCQNSKEQANKEISQHKRQMTNTKQKDQTPKLFNQFRSKSLKNAIKYEDSINNNNLKDYQNKKVEKGNKIVFRIQSKRKVAEMGVQKRKNTQQQQKGIVQYPNQNTTEATQSNAMCEIEKKIWSAIVEIILNITLDPGNLDWPEEYIVMDKQIIEKKLYQILDEVQVSKAKSKIRKHICITRVAIYLYSSMILHQIDSKSIVPIFQKLHSSFTIIVESVSSVPLNLCGEKLAAIHKNNQFSVKSLLSLLSKKNVPHQNLLKNMLQSSLKIQSVAFIDVVDKTLKWQILKMPSYPYLPTPSKQLHLVLDLDETLIHYDYNSQIFHVRPFAEQFLKKASAHFQITIFTAALQQYADEILEQIDPDHCISYKLYRNHLTYIDGVPVKDLSMLGRPLNKTIIVDNLASNYRLQPENGIQIQSWYDDDNDEALGKLYGLLLKIAQSYKHDVRVGVRQLSQFIKQQIAKTQLIYELRKQL